MPEKTPLGYQSKKQHWLITEAWKKCQARIEKAGTELEARQATAAAIHALHMFGDVAAPDIKALLKRMIEETIASDQAWFEGLFSRPEIPLSAEFVQKHMGNAVPTMDHTYVISYSYMCGETRPWCSPQAAPSSSPAHPAVVAWKTPPAPSSTLARPRPKQPPNLTLPMRCVKHRPWPPHCARMRHSSKLLPWVRGSSGSRLSTRGSSPPTCNFSRPIISCRRPTSSWKHSSTRLRGSESERSERIGC